MVSKPLAFWLKSAHWYGGRTWTVFAVLTCNLLAVTFFGGGIMLAIVSYADPVYLPLRGTSAFFLLASLVPMAATALLNRLYRRRCQACGR